MLKDTAIALGLTVAVIAVLNLIAIAIWGI